MAADKHFYSDELTQFLIDKISSKFVATDSWAIRWMAKEWATQNFPEWIDEYEQKKGASNVSVTK